MRIIILDRQPAPDVGHPTYIEDRPDLRDERVWAVACVQEDESGEDRTFDYEAEGMTYPDADAS